MVVVRLIVAWIVINIISTIIKFIVLKANNWVFDIKTFQIKKEVTGDALSVNLMARIEETKIQHLMFVVNFISFIISFITGLVIFLA